MSDPRFIDRLLDQLQLGSSFYDALRAAALRDSHVLEIGPGGSPAFRRRDFPNLKVSDYCDTVELRRQVQLAYKLPHAPVDLFDDVDYVCADSRLAAVVPEGQRFDLIYSSHNIEHQPDLLEHLRSLQALLKPNGAVALVIPHKQRTFDVFRRLTTTSDVLMGHYGPPGWMATKSAFDADSHSATPPEGTRHLFGPADPVSLGNLHQAFERFQQVLGGAPNDVSYLHHHVFTPRSLQIILIELQILRLCYLTPVMCTGAVSNSFVIVLQPMSWPDDPAQAAALEARLQEQRLAHYREMAFNAG